MIQTITIRIVYDSTKKWTDTVVQALQREGMPIRWSIVSIATAANGSKEAVVEASVLVKESMVKRKMPARRADKVLQSKQKDGPLFVHIVPTGIGASVGGSLGDAMPVNRVLSSLGTLVTHPNTCNGGPLLIADRHSFLYTEGHLLDQWSENACRIGSSTVCPRIGVVMDSGIRDTLSINRAINGVYGFSAHTGAAIVGIEMTKQAVGGEAFQMKSGAFAGRVADINTVLSAAEKLIRRGANRIAIFTNVGISDTQAWQKYFDNTIPNPVGAVEAMLSHSVVKYCGVPAAHAPILSSEEERHMQGCGVVRPSAGLEASDPSYIFCVLRGLMDAPDIYPAQSPYGISFDDVSALVCPASSLGGIPMCMAAKKQIPIIAVENNTTVLSVSGGMLGFTNVITVPTYLEAIGLLSLMGNKRGLSRFQLTYKTYKKDLKKIGVRAAQLCQVEPTSLVRA